MYTSKERIYDISISLGLYPQVGSPTKGRVFIET